VLSTLSCQSDLTRFHLTGETVISLLQLAGRRDLRRRTLFIYALAFVALMELGCVWEKVCYIEPEVFAREAVELKVTSRWRYGYAMTFHGVRLVRTPNVPLHASQ
jgi:hypothetical protein